MGIWWNHVHSNSHYSEPPSNSNKICFPFTPLFQLFTVSQVESCLTQSISDFPWEFESVGFRCVTILSTLCSPDMTCSFTLFQTTGQSSIGIKLLKNILAVPRVKEVTIFSTSILKRNKYPIPSDQSISYSMEHQYFSVGMVYIPLGQLYRVQCHCIIGRKKELRFVYSQLGM